MLRPHPLKIRHSGATVMIEENVDAAFERARNLSQQGYHLDDCRDTRVAEGYGTLALELIADCPAALTDVFVAVGGGAMLAGVGTVLKSHNPHPHLGSGNGGRQFNVSGIKAGKPVKCRYHLRRVNMGVSR